MKTYIKIVLFGVFFFALVAIGAALYEYNLKPKDLQKVKPDFVLTSPELQKSFEENETAANAKYINKIIEVNGVISSVDQGENNSLNVSLKTGSDFSSVICSFTKGDNLKNLDSGTQITIRGECSGYLMDVLLKNCAVITPQ
jgi:hypothetical protein